MPGEGPEPAVALDPRVNAYRDDLADARLRGRVGARRFVEGRAAWVTAGLAPVKAAPAPSAEIGTFYHYGEELLIFDEAGGPAWGQSLFDCYVGYGAAGPIANGPATVPAQF